MHKHTICLLLLCLLSWTLKAQSGGGCGTVFDSATVAYLERFEPQIQEKIQSIVSNRDAAEFSASIPVRFHFVRQTNGTDGQAHNTASLINALNARFSGTGFSFSQCGDIGYIDNSALFNYTIAQEAALRTEAYTPGVVNVYLVNAFVGPNSNVAGYTYQPMQNAADIIVMTYGAALTSTFAHEMGHFFGLYHTHGKINCGPLTDELANGCNCQTAGDNVCDTPADPGLAGLNCLGSLLNGCTYDNMTLRDANQQIFTPQTDNIMSYAPDNCRNQFTLGQKNRMAAQYQLYRTYLSCSTVCSEPTVSVGNITDKTVRISWNSASAIQLRELEIRTANGNWTPVILTPSSDNSATTLFDLQPGTSYRCRLRTFCENGVSLWKESGIFTTLSVCNTPTGMSTTVNTQSATFSWAPVAGALTYTIEIRPAGAPYWNQTVVTGGTSYTFPYADGDYISSNQGLGSNTPYEYRIRTNCSSGLSSAWSAPVAFTTASLTCNSPLPTDLEIISLTATSVTVRCNRTAFRYRFRKGQVGGGDGSFQVNLSTSNNRTFSGLEPCRVYQIQCMVQCQSGGASSYYSASIFFTTPGCGACPAPTGLNAAAVSYNSATLQWSHPGGIGYPYTMQWRTPGVDWSDISGSVSGTSITLRHLKPSTIYEFRMRSNCGNGPSSWTPTVSVTTAPIPCNPPRALRVLNDQVGATLSWTAPFAGAGTYTLEYRLNNDSWIPSVVSGTNRYINLPPNTPVQWRVRANCSANDSSVWRTGPAFTSRPQPALSVSPGTHQVGANATSATISVSATINWSATVSSGGTWLSICQSTGNLTGWEGNGSITASFSANTSPTPRTATVTVTGGGFTHQVVITQAGNSNPNCSNDNEPSNNSLSTAPAISTGADKQSLIGSNSDTDFWKFTLNSSQNATITLTTLPADYDLALFNSNGAQLEASANSGTTNESIVIPLAAGTYFARIIGYNGVFSNSQCYTLRVNTQPLSFALSPETQSVGAGAGSASLSVTGNVSWTATDNASWLSLSPGSGNGNGTITVSFSANPGSSARTATVTVGGGGITRTATITQAGIAAACNPPANLSMNNITQNTANIQWSAAPGATAYQVQVLINNEWTNVSAPTAQTSMTLYGMLPGISYRWRVITICAGNQQSAPSFAVMFTTVSATANCSGGTQSPAQTLTPSGSWKYQRLPGGGHYMLVNVQAGTQYIFSGCSSDGGNIPFDGQLSIRSVSDQLISYNDDICGVDPRIVWRAGFTGQVRVLLTRYNCQSENGNSIVAYRIENSFSIQSSSERDPAASLAVFPTDVASPTNGWIEPASEPMETLLLTTAPNPAQSRFTVHCDYSGAEVEARMQVVDVSGRMYKEDQVMLAPGINTWTIHADGWPANLYLVRLITNDGKTVIRKIQINP